MENFSDLFTPRQLVALTTFSDLVDEARDQVEADALEGGRVGQRQRIVECLQLRQLAGAFRVVNQA